MENNRFEEVEKKENGLVKILKIIGKYLKNLNYDFIASFKYNNMKLASILIAFPGIFFGFFLGIHSSVINSVTYVSTNVNGVDVYYHGMSFDFTGICIFILMLFSILNIFSATNVSKKKNLGSVVTSTITTTILTIAGCVYLYGISTWITGHMEFLNKVNELVANGMSLSDAQSAANGIGLSGEFEVTFEIVMVYISVILSIVAAISGCILGFINYDRTYEKVDR